MIVNEGSDPPPPSKKKEMQSGSDDYNFHVGFNIIDREMRGSRRHALSIRRNCVILRKTTGNEGAGEELGVATISPLVPTPHHTESLESDILLGFHFNYIITHQYNLSSMASWDLRGEWPF